MKRLPAGSVRLLVNFVGFQAGWFAAVGAGATARPWPGALLACAIAALNVGLAEQRGRELRLVAAAVLIGALADSTLARLGILVFHAGWVLPRTAPLWLLACWALFGTTISVSLRFLRERMALAALLGACGGPLAYLAGTRMGALALPDTARAVLVLALSWALWVPLLVALSARWERAAPRRRAP